MTQSFRIDLLVEPFFPPLLTALEYFATGGLRSRKNVEHKSPEEYLEVLPWRWGALRPLKLSPINNRIRTRLVGMPRKQVCPVLFPSRHKDGIPWHAALSSPVRPPHGHAGMTTLAAPHHSERTGWGWGARQCDHCIIPNVWNPETHTKGTSIWTVKCTRANEIWGKDSSQRGRPPQPRLLCSLLYSHTQNSAWHTGGAQEASTQWNKANINQGL